MEKLLSWIDKNKKKTVVIIAGIIIIPMLLVHILFKIKTGCYLLQADWESGDMLGYFGDVLSFLGTIVLGYIAIKQTEKANKISEKLMEMELIRSKPCFDFVNSQKYMLVFGNKGERAKQEHIKKNGMLLEVLYTNESRSGITTTIGNMSLQVKNSGHNDIRQVYIQNIVFYLGVNEPNSNCPKIGILQGDTFLKVGNTKRLMVDIKKEIETYEELEESWYKDNASKIKPHIELELHLVTVDGLDFYETIQCGSNWDITMKSNGYCIERTLVVEKIDYMEKNSKW